MAKTIALVGAGRVGRVLGRRLREAGWKIGAVVTRSTRSAHAAVRAIGSGRPHKNLTAELLQAEVVFITTPDGAIARVAEKMARLGTGRGAWRGMIVLHTSGALDATSLAPLAKEGASTGSLHPLQSFGSRGLPHLAGVLFAVEGDSRARSVAQHIARQLGGVPAAISGRNKPAYHAAGSLAAPHVLAVVETATCILMELGFTRRQAVRALLPLTRQTLLNYEQFGPNTAWTGPVSRGDYATVAQHLAILQRFPGEYLAAYAALTRLGARVLSRRPAATLRGLERFLNRDGKRETENGE